jgi:ankyrin repeat protein
MALIQSIACDDYQETKKLINSSGELAKSSLASGASRQNSAEFYFKRIRHYLMTGDTPLHAASAGYRVRIAKLLLDSGADVSARNRRGAQPLHYAADGGPVVINWKPMEQVSMIELLIKSGADPNSVNKNGVTPIHRAVRTRCPEAVNVLIVGGANVKLKNGNGSTPLHLAVQNTGRGGSGSDEAKALQKEIIELLIEAGADPSSRDGRGKTVRQCTKSEWILALL